jgi:hypothetical protein
MIVKLVKNKISLLVILAFSTANLSFVNSDGYTRLNKDDFSLLVSRDGPTITRDDGLETYWKWQCFSTQTVDVGCAKECDNNGNCHYDDPDYGEVTVVVTDFKGKTLNFDYEFESEDCLKKVEQIKSLLLDQRSFCVLAAYLQNMDPPAQQDQLWVLYRIKAGENYWGEVAP